MVVDEHLTKVLPASLVHYTTIAMRGEKQRWMCPGFWAVLYLR